MIHRLTARARGLTAAVFAGALALGVVPAIAASPAASAIVSVAEGPPFRVIRDAGVYAASRGIILSPGDIVESQPASFLVLEIKGAGTAALVGIGPATRAYWMPGRDSITLALLEGWIKVDTGPTSAGPEVRALARRLGAASSGGVYVLHAGADGDEVFHESGTMTLYTLKPDGTATAGASKPSEFASRAGTSGALQTRLGPAAAFVAGLPAAFRDPLPAGLSAKLRGGAEPRPVRQVSYDDLAQWLAAPRDWRRGFIERFEVRLEDPLFFRAMDQHMSAHPEWYRILHRSPAASAP